MRTRKWILATVALIFMGLSGDCRKCYLKVESSAQNFQGYFRAMRAASVNPMERFVFSLALANTKTHPSEDSRPPKRGS